MAFDQTYGLWHVLVGSTGLGGISRASVQLGTQVRAESSDGQVEPRFVSIQSQQPRASFDAFSIKSALALCGMSAVKLSESNLTLWAAAREDEGQRLLASSKKYTMVKGILVPERISAQHGSDATIGYGAYAGYDGSNNPVTTEDGTAPDWTTPPAGYDERYTVGPCLVGGIALYGVRSIDVAFGFSVVAEAADGEVWPRIVSIQACNSSITIRGIDLGYFASAAIPLEGKACTVANTKIYLRRRKQNGGIYADGDSEHIQILAPGLATIDQAYDASGQALAECSVTITCKRDGVNLPLAFTTTSTITMS